MVVLLYWFLVQGDAPARAFEAGQSIGGQFPCMYGVNIKKVPHAPLATGPFLDIADRCEEIASMQRNVPIDKMKVRFCTLQPHS